MSKSCVAKDEDKRQTWRMLRKAIFQRFVLKHESIDFIVYVDQKAVAKPGLPLSGMNWIRVPITRGSVDLTPLLGSDLPLCNSMQGLFSHLQDLKVPPSQTLFCSLRE